MTRTELIEFHAKMCAHMHETLKKKNADYSGQSGGNPFSNFVFVEQFGVASAEQGFFTRMLDKVSRIATYIKKGELQVSDESIVDTLIDLANYSLLMAAYLRHKREGAMKDRPEKESERQPSPHLPGTYQ